MVETPSEDGGLIGRGRQRRCWWCGDDEEYRRYHDEEWGRPQLDDRRLFEKLCLEGFQAGLSWRTILHKREGFRRAFEGFDFARIARWRAGRVERLLGDPGIVRHRGKIEAACGNARRALELVREHGSLAAYVWSFEPPARRGAPLTRATIPASTPESRALSADLRRRGWRFVGPTTVYAFMQAVGMVDDHLPGCATRPAVERARRALARPGRAARP